MLRKIVGKFISNPFNFIRDLVEVKTHMDDEKCLQERKRQIRPVFMLFQLRPKVAVNNIK